jgi:hypothetical protein
MSDGIHRFASDVWPAAHMAFSPGLADTYILVLGIADPPNRCPAFLANHAHFAARQYDSDPIAFFGHNSGSVAGTSD